MPSIDEFTEKDFEQAPSEFSEADFSAQPAQPKVSVPELRAPTFAQEFSAMPVEAIKRRILPPVSEALGFAQAFSPLNIPQTLRQSVLNKAAPSIFRPPDLSLSAPLNPTVSLPQINISPETVAAAINVPAGGTGSPIQMPITKITPEQAKPTAEVATGVVRGLEGLAEGFTSPVGIAALGIGALPATAQRAVSLGFATQMASQAPEVARQLGDEFGKPPDQRDNKKIAELITSAATTLGFTAAAGLHGLRPTPEVPGPVLPDVSGKELKMPEGAKPVPLKPDMASARRVADMSPEEFHANAQSFNKVNIDLGKNITESELAELRTLKEKVDKRAAESTKKVLEAENRNDLRESDITMLQMPQFFNEAIKEAERSIASRKKAEEAIKTKSVSDPQKIADDFGMRFDGGVSGYWNFTLKDAKGNDSTTITIKEGSTPEQIRARYEEKIKQFGTSENTPRPIKQAEPTPKAYNPAILSQAVKNVRQSTKNWESLKGPEITKLYNEEYNRLKPQPEKAPIEPNQRVAQLESFIEENQLQIEKIKSKPLTKLTREQLSDREQAQKENRAELEKLQKSPEFTTKPPVETPEPVSVGPGAQTAGEAGKPELSQLTDALKTMAESQPKPQTKNAFNLGEKLSQAKDSANRAVDGLRAAAQYGRDKMVGMPVWNGLKAAVGNWKLALFENGQINKQFVENARRAIPDEVQQGAISKWLEVGGDQKKLLDVLINAPAKTKKFYRAARNLTPEQKVFAENAKNYFDSRMQEAIDLGYFEDGIENYIHRMYEKDTPWKKGAIAELRSGIFTGKPSFAKQRSFQYDYEAEQAGYPVVQSFIKRIAAYDFALNKSIADRALVKELMQWKMPDGRPAIDSAGIGIPVEGKPNDALLIKPQFKRSSDKPIDNRNDYIPYDHPALRKWRWLDTDESGKTTMIQGNALVHPDALSQINAVFGRSKVRQYALGRAALGVSSTIKQTLLDLSGFHPVQITVHGWEHRTFKPVDKIDTQDPVQRSLITHGLEPGDPRGMEAFQEGVSGTSLTRHIPGIGPRLQRYNEWLFQDYIPRLKMAMGLHALERNRAKYADDLKSGKLTEDQLLHLTANEANAAFGELNYEMLGRNKTVQDALRLGLLAPDFLEARSRFAAQAATKYGAEQRQALFLGAATLYITARIINKLLDDQYHFETKNAFSVVYGKKSYSLRTVQGDILHAITEPGKFVYSRLNPVYGRTVMEAITGRDYFGRKRTGSEQLEDLAKTAVPISLRGALNPREQNLFESFLNAMGITERRETASDDIYKLADAWKQKHGVQSPGEFIYDPDKDPYRRIKLALAYDTPQAAAQELSLAIKEGKTDWEKASKYLSQYGNRPFAGSKANDERFKTTLSEDQQKTLSLAVKERQRIRQNAALALRLFQAQFRNVK